MIAIRILRSNMFAPPSEAGLMNKVENGAIKGADRLLIK
jgi:hypothetical protein